MEQKESDAIPITTEQRLAEGGAEAPKAGEPGETPNAAPAFPPISYFKLFSLADGVDIFFLILGSLTALATGVGLPLSSIFMGELSQSFDQQRSADAMIDESRDTTVKIVILGAIVFVLGGAMIGSWTVIGRRLGVKYRRALLRTILLERDITWFDKNRPQELPTKIASLCFSAQEAVGPKIANLIMSLAMGLVGLIIAFIHGWQLSLCLVALFPAMGVAACILTSVVTAGTPVAEKAYAQSGALAEETLNSIRTVASNNAQDREAKNYSDSLGPAMEAEKKIGFYTGLSLAIFNFTMDATLSLGYYIGSFFIQYKVYNHYAGRDYLCEDTMIVFYSLMFGFFSLGQAGPAYKAISEGTAAGAEIFYILEGSAAAEAKEKKQVEKGTRTIPDGEFKGRVEFSNVTFAYPIDASKKALVKFSSVFEPGKTTAICGESGCGKSTIFQLVEGFYPQEEGQITVDGVPLQELDINWLRSKIGFVGQEPVLFNTTIRENVLYGNPAATEADIIEACKKANCYDFIMRLANKLDTVVGIEGSQMSGGEKQRIALARAIVRKPKILLLDEATSALDRTNEAEVQRAINSVAEGITTIEIAHRLSTIKSADKIILIRDGVLMDQGKHEELMARSSLYATMYSATSEAESVSKVQYTAKSDVQTQEIEVKVERVDSVAGKEEQTAVVEKPEEDMPFTKAFKMMWAENEDNKSTLIVGAVLSLVLGVHFPIIGALNGAMFYDLLLTDTDEMRSSLNKELAYTLVTAFGCAIIMFISTTLFGNAAARVSHRTRVRLYEKMLKMDVAWFDEKDTAPSRLSTLLYEEAKKVNSVLDTVLGLLIMSFMSAIIAIGVGMYFNWRMALVVLVAFPLMAGSGILDAKMVSGYSESSDTSYMDSLKILSESIRNIRTVVAFSGEHKVLGMYAVALQKPLDAALPRALISGFFFGMSQFIQFCVYSATFYFGAIFVKDYDLSIKDMFISFYTMTLTAYSIGQSIAYAPDVGDAMSAIKTIQKVMNMQPSVRDEADAVAHKVTGKVEFRNVTFAYPARKTPVLKNISFTVMPGQKIGVVGISGSGKSTIIQLLERFYDIQEGDILFDGVSIKKIKLGELRHQLGLVAQEPTIFDRTIGENIAYGLAAADNAKIEAAAQKANALEFINASPHKFDQRTGMKGSLLSGGQKQRIAIARALIREPPVMLLDEATSALDTESEHLIQKGLTEYMTGKTAIVVAHRLSTIKDSDCIMVLEKGRIVEQGTHAELMAKGGKYHKLVMGTSDKDN